MYYRPLKMLWGFPGGSTVKNPPAMQETQVRSLGWEDPLEKEMATHSRILACLGNPMDYSPWNHKELDATERLKTNKSAETNINTFSFRTQLECIFFFFFWWWGSQFLFHNDDYYKHFWELLQCFFQNASYSSYLISKQSPFSTLNRVWNNWPLAITKGTQLSNGEVELSIFIQNPLKGLWSNT